MQETRVKYQIVNDTKHLRFLEETGEPAYIEYRYYKGDMAFLHTFVPESRRGEGIASALAEFALDFARAEALRILPFCPFMAKYIQEHPAYLDLVHHLDRGEFFPPNQS
jgi:predicted GNAT family acetyltransferase